MPVYCPFTNMCVYYKNRENQRNDRPVNVLKEDKLSGGTRYSCIVLKELQDHKVKIGPQLKSRLSRNGTRYSCSWLDTINEVRDFASEIAHSTEETATVLSDIVKRNNEMLKRAYNIEKRLLNPRRDKNG